LLFILFSCYHHHTTLTSCRPSRVPIWSLSLPESPTEQLSVDQSVILAMQRQQSNADMPMSIVGCQVRTKYNWHMHSHLHVSDVSHQQHLNRMAAHTALNKWPHLPPSTSFKATFNDFYNFPTSLYHCHRKHSANVTFSLLQLLWVCGSYLADQHL